MSVRGETGMTNTRVGREAEFRVETAGIANWTDRRFHDYGKWREVTNVRCDDIMEQPHSQERCSDTAHCGGDHMRDG